MKSIKKKFHLNEPERKALNNLLDSVRGEWPQAVFKIFGSKVNGTADEESDIDLLVILPCRVTEDIRRKIVHNVFKTNLDYGSNISTLIVSRDEWENGRLTVLPIHDSIESEGVIL